MKSKGLGDSIEKITEATGIKTLVHKFFGDDCGCDKRKELLNKMFPYKNVECLTEEEYNYLYNFNFKMTSIDPETQKNILKIYNRVFNLKQPITNCTSCWINIISQLEQVYNEYKNN